MPAAEELGQLVRDRVRFYPLKNLLQIQKKTEPLLNREDLADAPVSPRFLRAVIKAASWSDDDTIQSSGLD